MSQLHIPPSLTVEGLELVSDRAVITFTIPNGPVVTDYQGRRWALRELRIVRGREFSKWEAIGYLVKQNGELSEHRTKEFSRYYGLSDEAIARFDRIAHAFASEWAVPCTF